MFLNVEYAFVGEIMKKLLDKLFNVDKKVLVFLFIISFIGLLTGSLYMTVLDSNDKIQVSETLSGFLHATGPNDYLKLLTNNLVINLLSIFFIWILGLSVVGLPVVIFFIFLKSFVVSFSLSSFIANYQLKGTLLGFVYNFPHHFISLVIYIYLGVYAMKVSSILFISIMKKKSIDFKAIMNRYLLVLWLSLFTIVLMTIIETFLTPYLLKMLLGVL